MQLTEQDDFGQLLTGIGLLYAKRCTKRCWRFGGKP